MVSLLSLNKNFMPLNMIGIGLKLFVAYHVPSFAHFGLDMMQPNMLNGLGLCMLNGPNTGPTPNMFNKNNLKLAGF